MKRQKITNYLKTGILLFGVSLMLWNCQKNNEINELYDVSVNKKLDYTLEKIGYSKLITDQEIKKALPKIKQRFSEGKKQNRQSKKTPQISENFTIITDSIHKIITKDVITWAFKIETPVLKNSDFENFLVKKYNEKFSYFLVSYKKDLETKYKKATLYLISKESLNLDNLNLARKGDYLMDDNTNGGGGPCEGDIYTEIKSCDKGGYHTAKYCCQHYGGIHGCSNSKPCDYTCTGTDVVTIIDFTNCFNGGSLGPDNIPDYNPSDNDNTQNGDSGMSNSGGSTSSNGGTVITSPVTLECDNCSNSQSLISYLNLTDQTQIDWVNDANNNNIITELSSFIAFNNNSDEAINFVRLAINALISYTSTDYPGSNEGLPFEWWKNENLIENHPFFNQNPYNIWRKLTTKEKEIFKLYPAAAIILNRNKTIAEQSTISYYGTNGLNDNSDAFRHAYFNALNSREMGKWLAKKLSDGHESETPIIWSLEVQMDLFNNNIGHQAGHNYSNYNDIQMGNLIKSKINNGLGRYLNPINIYDSNFWDNPLTLLSGDGTHGISSTTTLTPTY